MSPVHDPQATGAAAVSVVGAVTSFAANALPIVQLIAGVVAIAAGVFAIAVSVKRLRGKDQ